MAAIDLESRARRLLVRLGSVPGDPVEARAFMQRRVRLYLAVALAIWSGVFTLDRLITFAFTGDLIYGSGRSTLVHAAITIVLALLYVLSRSGELSVVALANVDIVATTGQAFAFSAMYSMAPLTTRPDLVTVLGVTHVLVLRAAIVPGTARTAVGVGLIASAPPIVMSARTQMAMPRVPGSPPPILTTINVVVWLVIALAITAAIAAIIYGLQARVRAAMRLGQFTLLDKIGQGGMGVVYRARHALLRRPTAVKLLNTEEADERTLARFEREVQLTSEIAHPNVVAVYDFGRSPDGAFYYAMEFLEGLDLQRLVDGDGRQPPSRVAFILAQAAEALAEAHAVDLIHRDIKPANIVLCKHGRRPDLVKVVDFGLVKQLRREDDEESATNLSHTNAITGTPLYMPPEAIKSPAEVDGRSDLYSLGAVGYFLLTGKTVFEGKTVIEVCASTLHERVIPPSERVGATDFPPKLEALIMKCLAKSKADRPEDAESFLEALRGCDDVTPAWTSVQAKQWWKSKGDALTRATFEDKKSPSSEVTQTLAVAPRPDSPTSEGDSKARR